MKRRLALVTFVTTLLLLALSIFVWIFSHFRTPTLHLNTGNHLVTLVAEVELGGFILYPSTNLPSAPYGRYEILINPPNETFRQFNPAVFPGIFLTDGGSLRPSSVIFRLYWPTLILGLLSLLQFRYLPPRPNSSATLCPTCRYDCRATPDRCPECGTELDAGHPTISCPSRTKASRPPYRTPKAELESQ